MTENISNIVITATGAIVNSKALELYNTVYKLTGDQLRALGLLHDEADRENWARQESQRK